MSKIIYQGPHGQAPAERHVAVMVHRDMSGNEKGYFFDSAEQDTGGSGSFDWRMDEAISRAVRFAKEENIDLVVVRAKRDQP